MKHWKRTGIILLVLLVLVGIYYYVSLPAINIHAAGFWTFILSLLAVLLVIAAVRGMSGQGRRGNLSEELKGLKSIKGKKSVKCLLILFCAVFLFYIGGSVLSSPIINAKKYQKLLEPETRDFAEDVEQVDYNQIPLLDKDSAELLGNRKMGSMVDMVSQFEVSSIYSQINVKGRPVRVTPLVYASPIKWLTNQKQGIPAYITIDMATQNTDLVKLSPGIRYSQSEYFNRNIYRHLRFCYPTYIFDQLSFEIDDEGTPYWICPVKDFTIGLFGGQTIGKVVLCNAVTGECQSMPVEECPSWVDRVYPADLLIELYDYRCELEWTIAEQINEIEEQSRKLRRSNQFFIDTLSTAVEFRSSESGEHISRIRNVTQLLLEALGQQEAQYRFNSDMIEIISNAAAMHDIGKIAIPDAILNKPGRLTPEEFELMKSHTTRGCEILEKLSSVQLEEYYRFSYDICRYHHERWDGNGYPDHLKGSDIPIWAQVVSVADVYDALVSKRVYKPAFSHQTAVDMILNGECGIFNPMLMSILSLIAPQLEKFYTGNVLPADEPFEFR